MDTNVLGFTTSAQTVAAARYYDFVSSAHAAQTSQAVAHSVCPVAGAFSKLYVACDAGPGVGLTRSFFLNVNNVDSALTVQLSGLTATGNDTTHSVNVTAGQQLAFKTSASGATTATGLIRWSAIFTAAANTSLIMGNTGTTAANAATNYFPLYGARNATATAADHIQIMPTGGTIKNLYIDVNAAPGAGTSYQVKLFVNGVGSTLVASIADAATANSDTTHSVSVSAGDQVYYEIVPAGTPTARQIFAGVEFDPTVNGEGVVMFGASTVITSQTLVRYNSPAGAYGSNWGATEAPTQHVSNACVMKNLYIQTSVAPGASTSYQTQLSINTVAGNPTATIANAATTANDTTNTATVAAGDLIAMKVTPAGITPAAPAFRWSMVTYIAPPVTATGGSTLMMMGVG